MRTIDDDVEIVGAEPVVERLELAAGALDELRRRRPSSRRAFLDKALGALGV